MDGPSRQQSAFPSELPPRTQQTFKQRNCSSTRLCFSFTIGAYSLRTKSRPVIARRSCMILTMLLRLTLSIMNAMWGGYGWGYNSGGYYTSYILGSILAVIGFLSVGWSLATIGEAQGDRVFGMRITPKFFEVFIYVYFVATLAIFLGWFFGANGPVGGIVWSTLWIVIIPVSVVATLPARYPTGTGTV